MGRPMTRRQVLGYGLGATGALATAGRAGATATTPPAPGAFFEPAVLRSRGGTLSVHTVARPGLVQIGAPKRVSTFTFDGALPGYTWDVDAGDTLAVRMVNHLPPLEPHPMVMDRPHEWTTTNLHTHGLHVSPQDNHDNIFITIPPGGHQDYVFEIPADHPGGLFWYHPHRHGGVNQQLRGGMAGALIVRGSIDKVAEVAAATERVMIIQALQLGDNYQLEDPHPQPKPGEYLYPYSKVVYTLNGRISPTVAMYPGEVQRWRILNATSEYFTSLHLFGHQWQVLAWDGLPLAAPDAQDHLMLAPGNRVEVLVKAGPAGSYRLQLTPGDSVHPDIPGMPASADAAGRVPYRVPPMDMHGPMSSMVPVSQMPDMEETPDEVRPRTLLHLAVGGSGPPMGLPTALPAFDPPILPIARSRTLAFTIQRDQSKKFIAFGIDGRPYDPAQVPYRATLGTAEEWTLVNGHDAADPVHAHTYHVHVNPFRIVKVNGRPLATPLWRDTFVLTKNEGDSITFQTNFADFSGRFVEHCHMLSHEDLGMMAEVEVVP